MDSAPLTPQQLSELVDDVYYTELLPFGVFQIPFDDGSFAHLTQSTFVLGNANRYPDLNGTQCTYIGAAPDWCQNFTGMLVTRATDDFYAAVKAVISANVNNSQDDSSFEAEASSS